MEMKYILFLLTLLGLSCALQHDMQYEYLYKGVAITGIPGIGNQVAATGIRATLTLQMKTRSHGIAQLSKIEVGEFHDYAPDLQGPIPISYSPIKNHSHQLEKSFAVDFSSDQGHVLLVPSSDELWLVNIRKSIVKLLHIDPLGSQFKGAEHPIYNYKSNGSDQLPSAFSGVEETIHGRCLSRYTLMPIEGALRDGLKRELEDQLRGGAQKDELEDKYFKVVRGIDFDECSDKVNAQFTGIGSVSHFGDAMSDSIQSRSSVSTYILRGERDDLRIERAIVEGGISLQPPGTKSDMMEMMTNQTLILKEVGPISVPIGLPSKLRPIKTWAYEFNLPRSHSGNPTIPWIPYNSQSEISASIVNQYTLVGIEPSASVISQWMNVIIANIEEVASELSKVPNVPSAHMPLNAKGNTAGTSSASKLMESAELMSYLTVKNISTLFENAHLRSGQDANQFRNLLDDVAAASGSPSVIPMLLERVKLDVRDPYLASFNLINFANLAKHVCSAPASFSPMINRHVGDKFCSTLIEEDFLPFLELKLKECKKPWECAIIIQTISSFDSPQAIPVLLSIIKGTAGDTKKNLRKSAIRGLSRERMPTASRDEIFGILMELVDNTSEPCDVRMAAFDTLTSWEPSSSWLQRMAKSTWTEPCGKLAALITLKLRSIAKSSDSLLHRQANSASFALSLARPLESSYKNSFNSIYPRYEIINLDFEEFLHRIMGILVMKSAPDQDDQSLDPLSEIINSIKDIMEDVYEQDQEDGASLGDFGNIQPYLPIEILLNFFKNANSKMLTKGQKFNMRQFFDAAKVDYILTTDIGLPLIGSVSTPTVTVTDIDLKLESSEPARNLKIPFKTNYRLITKKITKLSVISPWSKQIIETGVDSAIEVNLPIAGSFSARQHLSEHSLKYLNFTLDLSSSTQKQFPVLYAHNIPYSSVKSIEHDKKDVKIITVKENNRPMEQTTHESDGGRIGIRTITSYSGDVTFASKFGILVDYFRKPELLKSLLVPSTTRLYQASLSIDPNQSLVQNISVNFLYDGSFCKGELLLRGKNSYKKFEFPISYVEIQKDAKKSNVLKVGINLLEPIKGFRDLPKNMSMQLRLDSPVFEDAEDFKDQLLRDEVKSEVSGMVNFDYNPYSPGSKPDNDVVLMKGTFELSKDMKELLLRETDKTCEEVEMVKSATYDKLNFIFGYNNPSPQLFNATYIIWDFLKGAAFPFISIDKNDFDQNQVKLDASRLLGSDDYTIMIRKPNEDITISNVEVPLPVPRTTSFSEASQNPSVRKFEYPNVMSKKGKCHIHHKKTKTFDKLKITEKALPCFTMASYANITSERWKVMTRMGDRKLFYAQLSDSRPGDNGEVELILTYRNAWLNGVPFYMNNGEVASIYSEPSHELVMNVYKKHNEYMAVIVDRMNVIVQKHNVELAVDERHIAKGTLRGMCGDFDLKKKYDRSGPEGCIYPKKKEDLLEYSWTIPYPDKDGCSEALLYRKQQEVAEFQEDCEKRPGSLSSKLHKPDNPIRKCDSKFECQLIYRIVRAGEMVCVTYNPLQICPTWYEPAQEEKVWRWAKCWKSGRVPEEIMKNMYNMYIDHYCNYPASHIIEFPFQQVVACKIKFLDPR